MSKKCPDCKHYLKNLSNEAFSLCGFKPKPSRYDRTLDIRGINEFYFCTTARAMPNLCGKQAKHFKTREVEGV